MWRQQGVAYLVLSCVYAADDDVGDAVAELWLHGNIAARYYGSAAQRRHDGGAVARRNGGGIGDCEKIMGNLLRAFAALLYLRYVPSAAFVRPYRQGASLEETKMSKKEKALKYIHTL